MTSPSSPQDRLRRFAISFYGAPPDCPLEHFCALLAQRGIGGIGLTPPVFSAVAPAELAALLARHGLRASSLNSAGYLLHGDATAAAAQASLDAQLLAAAAMLEAPVNLIPGGLLQAGGGPHDPARLRAALAAPLAALAARAQAQGAVLSLEPMHPVALGLRSCINQISTACAAISTLPGDVGLTLDLFHSHWDDGMAALLREAPGLLRVVQICGVTLPADGGLPSRARLGAGDIDVRSFLHALDATAYRGMIEYEVFFEAMGRPCPEELIDTAIADLLDLESSR